MTTSENNNDPENDVAKLRDELAEKQKELDHLQEKFALQEKELSGPDEGEDEDETIQDITLVEILKNPEITKAINTTVNAWANTKPEETKLKFRSLHLGFLFSILVLSGIGVLGYLGVIGKEVTGTLLGSLIGYWFGKQRKEDNS